MIHRLLLVLLLTFLWPTYLLSPLPSGDENKPEDDVKDLKSLRAESNKASNHTKYVIHQYDVQPEPMPTPLKNSAVLQQANPIFRHRGITQAKKSKTWNEKFQQPSSAEFSLIQYSPSDLAAYVFNTGDEEGVAVAVEELVREGMMGRTDAINYLQDVKQILAYLRDQYEQKLEDFKKRDYSKFQLSQRISQRDHSLIDMIKKEASVTVTTEHPHQVVVASTSKAQIHSFGTTTSPNIEAIEPIKEAKSESNKDEFYKLDEYKRGLPQRNSFTLEVIYKLAKDMFTQSILRDEPTAEDTLSGLVTFLESEVGNKRISPEMKEKVLEIVSMALVDSLREGYLTENQALMFGNSGLYQHRPDSSGPSKALVSEVYSKLVSQG